MKNDVPSLDQIKRLQALQGVDAGVFTLAVYSTIEAYIRNMLGCSSDTNVSFYDLLDDFRGRYARNVFREGKVFHDIRQNKKVTNIVRHNFKNLSVEEANCAVYLFKEFAEIFCLPNLNQIALLTRRLDVWKLRKSPAETAMELEKANLEIQRLSKQYSDMSIKVAEYEKIKKEQECLDSKLKVLQLDYDQQIEKNRKNKEKIDSLRQEKHLVEEENRKVQQQLKSKMQELSDVRDYIENLRRMSVYTKTRYDYEQGLVHLTKEQKAIVNQVKFDHDFLVKGSAGTGKSLVLLKTLEKLLLQNESLLFEERSAVRLITFSRSLEKYNRYIASLMSIKSTACNANFVTEEMITTSESFLGKILNDAFPDIKLTYSVEKCLEDEPCIKENPLGNDIWVELEKFILPNFMSEIEYCDKNPDQSKKIWQAVKTVFAEWDKREVQPVPYVIYKLLQKISEGNYSIPENLKVDYLFVDEAQDLNAASLRLLKLAVRNCMILAGDSDQSVFQPGFTWSRAGIDITGNTKILHINFRSTIQINSVAEKYRALINGCDADNAPETFRMGPPVELHEDASPERSYANMIDVVRMCLDNLGYEPENICLIAPKKKQLEKLQVLLKESLGLESSPVNSETFDFSKPGIVRLATAQSCKGLDFPVVLFYIDHRAHFLDVFDEDVADKMNRNMIYTALTRSIELLHVFMPQNVSDGPIGDLKNILKASD